jgi:hypothetical protein
VRERLRMEGKGERERETGRRVAARLVGRNSFSI